MTWLRFAGILLLIFWAGAPPLKAQTYRGPAGYQEIYQFKNGEVIGSIGAGAGFYEVLYSLMADSLTLYLQDINVAPLQIDSLEKMVQQVYHRSGRTVCTNTFLVYKGSDSTTNLPNGIFDKLLLEHSLHEFTQPEAMLRSILANLKPGGTLFVREYLARRPNKRYHPCGHPMLSAAQLKWWVEAVGFRLVKQVPLDGSVVFQFVAPSS